MGVLTYEPNMPQSSPLLGCTMPLFLMLTISFRRLLHKQSKLLKFSREMAVLEPSRKLALVKGSEYSYVKHKVEGIDKDNFDYSYSLIEGDAISDKIEKISYEIKLVASGSGSIIKNTSHYHTKGDVEIKEEHVKVGKDKAHGLFKLIENYLVANPDAYN
uniref:Major allergen Mal d 1 n=1 Tax=Malus domestica TaxID=3750 RepID=B0B0L8_MALDO|nr:PR-10 protein [Malus domestica]